MIDIILAIPLLYGAYKGFSRGLIIEIASLVGLLLGIYGSIKFSYKTEALLEQHLDVSGGALQFISFVVTFFIILGGVFFLGKLLEKVVNLVAMKIINKLSGAVFGILKFGIVLSVILMIIESIDQQWQFIPQEKKSHSYLYQPVAAIVPTIFPMVGETDWYSKITKKAESVEVNVSVDELNEALGTSDK